MRDFKIKNYINNCNNENVRHYLPEKYDFTIVI